MTPPLDFAEPTSVAQPRMFPPRLGNGVSRLPWLPPAAGLAVVASLWGSDCISAVVSWESGNFIAPTLISSIPVIGCVAYLTRRGGTTIQKAFGLRVAHLPNVLRSGVLLFVLEFCLALATGVVLSSLGLEAGSEPTGGASKALASFFVLADLNVWAPLFEELGYRGLLYTALRTRFGVASSALVTAALFAFTHPLDSVASGAIYLIPAVLSSLWYERTRTLWPNVISHALANFMFTLTHSQ